MENDIVYSKKDAIDIREALIRNELNGAEQQCTAFPISCSQNQGVWGIWLHVEDDLLLVDPIDLVSSLFQDDRYFLLDYYRSDSDGEKPKGRFYVDIKFEDYCFHWKLSVWGMELSGVRNFTVDEYVGKTMTAITELYRVWSDGNQVAYEKDIKLDAVEMCKKQLDVKATLPRNYTLQTSEVTIEKFRFEPVKDDYNEEYYVGVGSREYKTFLTDWDNDLERIRHQFETYVYERDANIKLYFDMSETIIKISKRSVLDQIIDVESGCSYKYKDFALVEVQPNEFVKNPIIKGYCDEKETIRTMYEGLLKHAMRMPVTKQPHNDTIPRLVAYNKIKSPLIESYLNGKYNDDDEYSIRQVHVKHILTICPDYDALFYDEENVFDNGFEDLYDKFGKPFEMHEFLDWQKEINPIVVASETGESYNKDWVNYHRRGLELAKQLREKLSTDFDLWYQVPYEDKSGTIKNMQLII